MDDEDQSARDARVDKLWNVLDTRQEGQLNISGLKKGLLKLDHRLCMRWNLKSCTDPVSALKNADSLLQEVLKAVDTNGDGHIDYSGTSKPLGLVKVNVQTRQNSESSSNIRKKSYGSCSKA